MICYTWYLTLYYIYTIDICYIYIPMIFWYYIWNQYLLFGYIYMYMYTHTCIIHPADVFSLSGSKMLPMRACRLGFPDPLLAAYFSIGCHWELVNLSNMVMKMGCFSMVNTCYESVVNDVEHLWCFIGKSVIYVYGGPSTSKRLQEGNRFFWGLSWAIYHKNRFIFED